MIKKFFSLFLIMMMLLGISFCISRKGVGGSPATTSILPDQFTLGTPGSMDATSRSIYTGGSIGHSSIYTVTQLTANLVKTACIWVILIDSVLYENGIALGSTNQSNKTVAINTAIKNRIKAILPDEIDNSFVDAISDQTITLPAFDYKQPVTGDPENANNSYNRLFMFQSASDEGYIFKIYWNATSKKIKLIIETNTAKAVFTYDPSTQIARTLHIDKDNGNVGEFSIMDDANNTHNDGKAIVFNYRAKDPVTNRPVSVEVKGYADNTGGYIETTFSTVDSNNVVSTIEFKEGFNSSGAVDFQSMSQNGNDPIVIIGTEPSGDFDDKLQQQADEISDLQDKDSELDNQYESTGMLKTLSLTGASAGDYFLVYKTDVSTNVNTAAASSEFVGFAYGSAADEVQLEIANQTNFDASSGTLYFFKRKSDGTFYTTPGSQSSITLNTDINIYASVVWIFKKQDLDSIPAYANGFLTVALVMKEGAFFLTDSSKISSITIQKPDSGSITIRPDQPYSLLSGTVYDGYVDCGLNTPHVLFQSTDTSINNTNLPTSGDYTISVVTTENPSTPITQVKTFTAGSGDPIVGYPGSIAYNTSTRTVSWTATTGATGYRILIFKGTSEDWTQVVYSSSKTPITGLTHVIPDEIYFENGQQYCFKVSAHDGTGGDILQANYVHRSSGQVITINNQSSDLEVTTPFAFFLIREDRIGLWQKGFFAAGCFVKKGGIYVIDNTYVQTIEIKKPDLTTYTVPATLDFISNYIDTNVLGGYMNYGGIKEYLIADLNYDTDDYASFKGTYTFTLTDPFGATVTDTTTFSNSATADTISGFPTNIAFNTSTKTVTWTGTTGATGYRVLVFKSVTDDWSQLIHSSSVYAITGTSYTLPSDITIESGQYYFIMVSAHNGADGYFYNTSTKTIAEYEHRAKGYRIGGSNALSVTVNVPGGQESSPIYIGLYKDDFSVCYDKIFKKGASVNHTFQNMKNGNYKIYILIDTNGNGQFNDSGVDLKAVSTTITNSGSVTINSGDFSTY